MDLDEYQKTVTLMSSIDLQRERAGLRESIRKSNLPTLDYDEDLLAAFQTLETRLHVVQTEITARIKKRRKKKP